MMIPGVEASMDQYHDFLIAIITVSTAFFVSCVVLGFYVDTRGGAPSRNAFLSWLPMIIGLEGCAFFGIALFVALAKLAPGAVLDSQVQVIAAFLFIAPLVVTGWRLRLAFKASQLGEALQNNELSKTAAAIILALLISGDRVIDVFRANAPADVARSLFGFVGTGVVVTIVTVYICYRLRDPL
jgi:hypothetical protein